MTDFGIAHSLNTLSNTQTGTVLGTSHYIAPEQARGEHVDAQTDIYSFGVVLYELLTGELPYSGDNFLTVAMKHVNEPIPSVFDRRPDTPLRLASLIERCMAKSPADRPATMDDVVGELEACRAELDGKDGGEATMILRKPRAAPARPQRRRARRGGMVPLLAFLAGLLLLAAAAGGIYLAVRGDDPGANTSSGDAVTLSGVGAFDPDGGDGEHDDLAGLATDGNPATFWRTSTYRSQLSAFKSGVGLVLKASGTSDQIAVTTDTPGFTAEVRAGASPQGPFETVGAGKVVQSTTTWDLQSHDAQYYVIWITQLIGSAHVNEVKAN